MNLSTKLQSLFIAAAMLFVFGQRGHAQVPQHLNNPICEPLPCRGPVVQYLICRGGFYNSAQIPVSIGLDAALGEIRMVANALVPEDSDWLPCDGRLLPISLRSALFSLLANRYGGNGTTEFALPDLWNAAPVGTP